MSSKRHFEEIPCNSETPCKYREEDECFEDIHHEAFPKSAYRDGLEKRFREHVLNKVLICRAVHDDIHAQNLIPQKPSPEQMIQFMARKKDTDEN